MGPPLLGFLGCPAVRPAPGSVRVQRWGHHTISKKALQCRAHADRSRLELSMPPAQYAEQAFFDARDRTPEPETMSWLAVGVGLHLLFLAFAGKVASASLAG